MSRAPVAVFLSARPERAAALLESLRRAEGAAESSLTIFCDAPRNACEGAGAASVRRLAREVSGFRDVEINEAAEHEGRSRQIVNGVSALLREHDRVVVVEDDLLVSPAFLRFMNDGLDQYAGEKRVASVCGSSFELDRGLPETFFLPGAQSWGWATWRGAWPAAPADPGRLLQALLDRDLIHAFDAGGAEPLMQALQDAVLDGDTPWTLCWMASAILAGRLTLHPGRALAVNVDARGLAVAPIFETSLSADPVHVARLPVAADEEVLRRLRDALVKWRSGRSRAFRCYARVAALLPPPIEKSLYSALIRYKLRQDARRHRDPGVLPSSGRAEPG